MPKAKAKPARKPRAKTKSGKRNDYTDAERVAALLALEVNKWDYSKTARDLDLPRTTLVRWANGDRCYRVLAIRDRYRGDMLKQLKDAAWLLIDSIQDPAAVKRATLSQRSSALGVALGAIDAMERRDEPPPPPNGGVNVNLNLNIDLTALTDDELDQYGRLLDKIDRGGTQVGGGVGAGAAELRALPADDVPGDSAG